MELTPWKSAGVRMAAMLTVLAMLFAGVVYLTILDRERMEADVKRSVSAQRHAAHDDIDRWYAGVVREHARQMAAPFLWDVDTLEGVTEGTAEFKQLQRRMWQFVYGKDAPPLWKDAPVGPLESVVVVDTNHHIVAASDPMVVDQRYTDAAEIELLDKALAAPQLRQAPGKRGDGRQVRELSVGVPNARGEMIGVVRLRYVGGELTDPPELPLFNVKATPQLYGPALAGLVAILGVAFGAYGTWQVIGLTKRLEAMAKGIRLAPASGPGEKALSVIEEKLDALSSAVRRDDLMLASLTEALREGMVLLDPQGRAVVISRQARQVLGLDPSEAGNPEAEFGQLIDTNPTLADIVNQGLAQGAAVRERPVTLRLPGGRRAPAQITTYVLHDGDRSRGIMVLFKDRSSIELLERHLREASRLGTIAQLTGSLAHEVKNPLGAIGIHLEHLRRGLTGVQTSQTTAEERVRIIRDEIDRLHATLEEWLRFTGPDDRAPGGARVADVLISVGRLLRVEARHQDVELLVECQGDCGSTPLSATALRQVLLNLALNALQAMPKGGRLLLRAEIRDGQQVHLEVTDSGPGIPEAAQSHIFELHYTTRPGGSGLGLAICKRLVDEAGGQLTFVSREGQGTTFNVTLPMENAGRVRAQAS